MPRLLDENPNANIGLPTYVLLAKETHMASKAIKPLPLLVVACQN